MEKTLLSLLILLVCLSVYMMERWTPQLSPMIFPYLLVGLYGLLITVGMIHQKRKAWKNPKQELPAYYPSVSIIVPAHNEASVIERTVARLCAIRYPDYEIWVIDDRSTDNTAQVLKKMAGLFPNLRWYTRLPDAFPGKSAVLNEALERTTGEVICVFDADAVVESDFLLQMAPFLAENTEEKRIGAVQARKVICNANQNGLALCQNFEYSLDSHFQAGRDAIRGAVELRGNGQLIKRSALLEVGGWNNFTVTDDLDLSTRLHLMGWDVRFAHKVLVYEEGITSFMPLIRQRRRWAEGSLIRYLQYFGQILVSDKISIRAKADMIAYLMEFLFPLILITDMLALFLNFVLADHITKYHVIVTLATLPFLMLFFTGNLVIAIIRFNRLKFIPALGGAILTGLYMQLLWIPVVFGVMVRILFRKPNQSLDWGKTEHVGGFAPH